MSDQTLDPDSIGDTTDEGASHVSARAKIEEQLRELFRHAGDNEQTRTLLQMVIEYRWKQQQ